MFKHPYPVGYKATKQHFNATYTMEILEGPPNEGPIFTVRSACGAGRNTPTGADSAVGERAVRAKALAPVQVTREGPNPVTWSGPARTWPSRRGAAW